MGELRLEGDCRLIQRTSGDFLTTRKLFDFLLVQFAVFVALGHCSDKRLPFNPARVGLAASSFWRSPRQICIPTGATLA